MILATPSEAVVASVRLGEVVWPLGKEEKSCCSALMSQVEVIGVNSRKQLHVLTL